MSTITPLNDQIGFSVLTVTELEELRNASAVWFSEQAEINFDKQSDLSCYVGELLEVAIDAAKDAGDMRIEALLQSTLLLASTWRERLYTLARQHEAVIRRLHAAESIVRGEAK